MIVVLPGILFQEFVIVLYLVPGGAVWWYSMFDTDSRDLGGSLYGVGTMGLTDLLLSGCPPLTTVHLVLLVFVFSIYYMARTTFLDVKWDN